MLSYGARLLLAVVRKTHGDDPRVVKTTLPARHDAGADSTVWIEVRARADLAAIGETLRAAGFDVRDYPGQPIDRREMLRLDRGESPLACPRCDGAASTRKPAETRKHCRFCGGNDLTPEPDEDLEPNA